MEQEKDLLKPLWVCVWVTILIGAVVIVWGIYVQHTRIDALIADKTQVTTENTELKRALGEEESREYRQLLDYDVPVFVTIMSTEELNAATITDNDSGMPDLSSLKHYRAAVLKWKTKKGSFFTVVLEKNATHERWQMYLDHNNGIVTFHESFKQPGSSEPPLRRNEAGAYFY